MTKKWAKDAAEKELPDVEVVEKPAKGTGAKQAEKPDRPGPSAKDLRRKYLGAEAGAASDSAGADGGDDEDDNEVEVMQVRNKKTSADPADDPGARALIVSKKRGILGSAG